jgi:Integrin beta chain VWA domain
MSSAVKAVKVSPENINLTVANKQGSTYVDMVTVDIPQAKGVIPKIDVYFLSDTTASMDPVLDAVKKGASQIVDGLHQSAQKVEADLHLGVGDYKDVEHSYTFKNQQSITSDVTAVTNAINNWKTSGGATTAEGQLYALDQLAQPPGGSIGWRAAAKRIVVWFGDAPGHDPICSAISGLTYKITEQSVTDNLKKEGIFVLAISTPTGSSGPGLNVDPKAYSEGGKYKDKCGEIGGRQDQASRITKETWGEFADQIKPERTMETILKLGGAKIEKISKVSLVADGEIAPFLISAPADVPVKPGKPVTCQATFGSVMVTANAVTTATTGVVDIKVDGVSVGRQTVTISNPDLTGRYKIQSMQHSELFLQISDVGGWVVNVGEGGSDRDQYQQWELTLHDGNYFINNLCPRPSGDKSTGRYLEAFGPPSSGDCNKINEDKKLIMDGLGIVTRHGPPSTNHQWRVIPVGADSGGPIYRIETAHCPRYSSPSFVVDTQGAQPPDRKVILFHYWGNHCPRFIKEFGQHWRLLAL